VAAPPPEKGRLRWQCRRGMLELDYVLERYLDEHYDAAGAAERADFVTLLGCQDQDLNRWLILGDPPDDPALAPLIRKVRGI
jgi:antitoxin CptB